MKMNDNVYDMFKFIATTALPALITFIGVVGVQLGYEMTTTVVILTAFNTFLGTILGLSSMTYKKDNEYKDE